MNTLKRTLCTALLPLALSLPIGAYAENEVEPNQPVFSPQELTAAEEMEIRAVLGTVTGPEVSEQDFYSFTGQLDDVVTVDIDCGYACGQRSVDTVIAIFGDAASGFKLLRTNDDGYGPLDPGSNHPYDARIDDFHLPKTGKYYIGVSHYDRYFRSGGLVTSGRWSRIDSGDYQLIITGVTPAVMQVDIEVKPSNSEWTPINPKAKGRIPVAILSTENFDPMELVDPASLKFGRTGEEESLKRCKKQGRDVNRDGVRDMICFFSNRDSGFDFDTIEGVLTGSLVDGTNIEGRAPLKMVPQKRQSNGNGSPADRPGRGNR